MTENQLVLLALYAAPSIFFAWAIAINKPWPRSIAIFFAMIPLWPIHALLRPIDVRLTSKQGLQKLIDSEENLHHRFFRIGRFRFYSFFVPKPPKIITEHWWVLTLRRNVKASEIKPNPDATFALHDGCYIFKAYQDVYFQKLYPSTSNYGPKHLGLSFDAMDSVNYLLRNNYLARKRDDVITTLANAFSRNGNAAEGGWSHSVEAIQVDVRRRLFRRPGFISINTDDWPKAVTVEEFLKDNPELEQINA